jgi:glutamine synthetase
MREWLSGKVYKAIKATIQDGTPLDPAIAEEIADAMKSWAISKGATHFTHWFQPLTGTTAEKHDSFLTPDFQGGVIAQFSGKELIQGEPDASSFPSGGLRATFEARGYTAWDPTSHAFVFNAHTSRAVLCIPTVFCGYHGEALDVKTPLLRSQAALVKQLKRVGTLFNVPETHRPYATLGSEQEYFLIDRKLYESRPDIIMTGRTLFGRRPARHQQMEDHYFGRIKKRVLEFMADVDNRLWRLGVPSKTRHNEVSPAQFEIAPVFEEQNLAVDHNLVIMHTLQDLAPEHGFQCLLHEKPFAGVNGSGKHNNWSIVGTDGKNWFTPGETPHENAKFLFMLASVLKAIDSSAAIIRASVASAANDHRLGANEAPPAIMSVYLGEQLEDIISQIETGGAKTSKKGGRIEIGVSTLPSLPRDVTDRNRTSPFAFTGNKFEFRAVGSSQSCAEPNTALNLAMAAALDEMLNAIEKKLPAARKKDTEGHSKEFHAVLQDVLQDTVAKHKRIIFDGDGYSPDWKKEAAKRKLPNLETTPEALKTIIEPATIALYSKYGVLTEREARSRYEVYLHTWGQIVNMEGGCALDLSRTFIIPAALEMEKILAKSLESAEHFGRDDESRRDAYTRVAELVEELYRSVNNLETVLNDNNGSLVVTAMLELRKVVDQLEDLVPDKIWPFPCYGEMFFTF